MNKLLNKEELPAKSEELLWQLAEASYQDGSPGLVNNSSRIWLLLTVTI